MTALRTRIKALERRSSQVWGSGPGGPSCVVLLPSNGRDLVGGASWLSITASTVLPLDSEPVAGNGFPILKLVEP